MSENTKRPIEQELLDLLSAARRGDDLAYERIRAGWHEALVGLVRRLTGWSEQATREVTLLTWKNQRHLITRSAVDGGYRMGAMPPSNRPRMFHTFVLMDCTDWGRVLARHAEILPAETATDPAALDQADSSTPPPPELIQRLHACEALFGLICHPRTGYPHQQLAFLFSKYVFAKGEEAGQGDALRTDSECGALRLRELAHRLAHELSWLHAFAHLGAGGWPERVLGTLSRRLSLTVREMLAENNDTQGAQRFAHLLDRTVGDTSLRDYYPASVHEDGADRRRLTQNLIAEWCRKVGVKLRDQLGCRSLG